MPRSYWGTSGETALRRTASELMKAKRRSFPFVISLQPELKDGPGGEKRRVQRDSGSLQQRRKEKIPEGELMKKVKVWKKEWEGEERGETEGMKE